MLTFTLAFLAGDLYLQTCTQLPTTFTLILIFMLTVIGVVLFPKQFKYCLVFIGLAAGFCYSAWYAQTILSWSLPKELENKEITITGHIASLPVVDSHEASFFFALETLQGKPSSTLLRLSWRAAHKEKFDKNLLVGDKWQFNVKLKRIHGTYNPGGFNYEAWAVQRGLRANGYVLAKANNILLAQHWYYYPLSYMRQTLQARLLTILPHTKTAPWLVGLILGERNGVAQQDWQVLRRTGTNHLMAIAGLHIGIIAGFMHFIMHWLWRRLPRLTLRLPAQLAGGCAALLVGVFYSALAGFSIPAQRACIMLTIFISALLSRRKVNAWYVWSLALLFVLLLNPLSVLTESFWLSFATIALIIYGMRGRLAPQGWWWKWGRVQWVIAVGLIPITLVLFQQCSLIGFIANSIAIPWLGFFILPFCLLTAISLFFSSTIASVFLFLADQSLRGLWLVLTYFAALPQAVWIHSLPTWWLIATTTISVIILLIPVGMPGRWLGVLWLLLGLLYRVPTPKVGEFWLTLLDVGQGLSVVVQTHTHNLIFDAGPRFNEHFDMGESVVLPFLMAQGVTRIDKLIVSHGDNDHIGGAFALLHTMPVISIQTSVPDKFSSPYANRTQLCLAGNEWKWDGVYFKFLHPAQDQLALGNNSSCVLRIHNKVNSILITGDIEKNAEKILLNSMRAELAANILIAPHHGSKTSGLNEFIHAVQPAYVLYATGYYNRYHFPHPSVVASYQEIHAIQLATADTGAQLFQLTQNRMITPPILYRKRMHRYYNDQFMLPKYYPYLTSSNF